MASPFAEAGYQALNLARQEHLASLGLPIAGRTVLEVGAGVGDHTEFFNARGCDITVTDARPVNVAEIARRWSGLRALVADVEDSSALIGWLFDIVYCYGVLYHTGDPVAAIENLSRWSGDLLLLETCVSKRDGIALDSREEDAADPRNSPSGSGCLPSRAWLFDSLSGCFEYVYIPVTQPDHPEFPLDWPPSSDGLTRAVFVASRRPIDNPMLTETLPSHYEPMRARADA